MRGEEGTEGERRKERRGRGEKIGKAKRVGGRGRRDDVRGKESLADLLKAEDALLRKIF